MGWYGVALLKEEEDFLADLGIKYGMIELDGPGVRVMEKRPILDSASYERHFGRAPKERRIGEKNILKSVK